MIMKTKIKKAEARKKAEKIAKSILDKKTTELEQSLDRAKTFLRSIQAPHVDIFSPLSPENVVRSLSVSDRINCYVNGVYCLGRICNINDSKTPKVYSVVLDDGGKVDVERNQISFRSTTLCAYNQKPDGNWETDCGHKAEKVFCKPECAWCGRVIEMNLMEVVKSASGQVKNEPIQNPPIGVMPEHLWREQRMWTLIDRLAEHHDKRADVDPKWLYELYNRIDDTIKSHSLDKPFTPAQNGGAV